MLRVSWVPRQVIFLRVFPGVISDTFKANRIKEQVCVCTQVCAREYLDRVHLPGFQHIKSSRSTKCFICGLESHVFTLTGSVHEFARFLVDMKVTSGQNNVQ